MSMEGKELLNYIRLLREKSNANKLIIFVGAGVSRNVEGMPSWNDLIKKMADSIGYSRCKMCKDKDKNCKKTCKFKETYSTDEYLKIPQYVYNKNKKLYKQVLLDNIQHDESIDAPLSNAIVDLVPAHIITTNYDKLIENCKNIQCDNYEVIIHDKDLLRSQKNRYIIKMHGDISEADTIVLKEADYLEYSQNHVLMEMFVKSLLADHTILFLGYSMNDYNIKLMISWINYIRMQNNTFGSGTTFGYIVLDDEKITRTQHKYFESNNIGVINLHNMPLVDRIPSELTNDIGKRLYSFLKIIKNTSLERFLGKLVSYDEIIHFMKKFKYVDYRNLCNLLYLGSYTVADNILTVFSDSNFDSLVDFLKSGTSSAAYLKQALYDAGISGIELVSATPDRRYEVYKITDCYKSIIDNVNYALYLNNDYIGLIEKLNDDSYKDILESCFYKTLVQGYQDSVFEDYKSVRYDKLATEKKVRYLFNMDALEKIKTNRYTVGNVV